VFKGARARIKIYAGRGEFAISLLGWIAACQIDERSFSLAKATVCIPSPRVKKMLRIVKTKALIGATL
jgi:hypothetical protein